MSTMGRMLREHRGTAALLAVLVMTASLLISGLPRMVEQAYDDALRQDVTTAPTDRADVTVLRPLDGPPDLMSPAELAAAQQRWYELMPPALRRIIDTGPGSRAHHSVKSTQTPVSGRVGSPFRGNQFVNLAWLSDADQRVRYVEGRPPGPPTMIRVADRPDLGEIPRFDIALCRDAVTRMGLPVGTVLLLGNSGVVAARVTGIFEPIDPADRYWQHNWDLLRVEVIQAGESEHLHVTALSSPEVANSPDLQDRRMAYRWVLPVRGDALSAGEAARIADAVAVFSDRVRVAADRGTAFDIDTALPALLEDYLARQRDTQTLLMLILGGLVVVALGVILLTVWSLAERMRRSLGLMRARGGSLRQVAGSGAGVVALVAVPSALAGYAGAAFFPGPATPLAHAGPAALVLAAVAFAGVSLARVHRSPLRDRRDDVTARRPSARRLTLEAAVIVVALTGAYLLRARGLTTSAGERGGDPFLALVPVALTVAAALILLRCYPYPLRLLLALLGRARGAVPFLGLAFAARARVYSTLPVLILLPALTVSTFSATVASALDTTQQAAAWRLVGADARLDSEVPIPPEAIERVRRVPGVQAVVPAAKAPVHITPGDRGGFAVAMDLDAYRAILPEDVPPVPRPPADQEGPRVAALVSRDLLGYGQVNVSWTARITVVAAGVIERLPGVSGEQFNLVLLPPDANERAGGQTLTNMLFIRGTGLDPEKLAAAADLPAPPLVVTYEDELNRLASAPLAAAVRTSLVIATVALGGYALVSVVILLTIGGAERATAMAFLRALGLSERQARGVTMLEIVPMIALTALAGLALGLAMPAALGSGLDLSPYTGGVTVEGFSPDLLTPALSAVGIAGVTVLGVFAHAAISRRRSPNAVLRAGG